MLLEGSFEALMINSMKADISIFANGVYLVDD